jgi:DNA-binding IclR family transcriptional regulator
MSTEDEDSGSDAASRYTVPALARGLALLKCFTREKRLFSGAELARALNLPRASTFRLVTTLAEMGFLEREGDAFRLGPAVLSLGFEYLASLEITDLSRPVLEELRDTTRYSAHLAIRDGSDALVVQKVVGASAYSSWVNVGTRLPAHATVLGRALLIDMTPAELKRVFDGRLTRFTPHTPSSIKALGDVLAQEREAGLASSQGFYETGISSLAAPVRDASARVVAALSITIPRTSIEPDDPARLGDAVKAAATALSVRLDYRA